MLNKIKNLITCPHRHTIEEHPACFAQGNVIDRRLDRTIPWYQTAGSKICYLDIESDGLKVDFSNMLTWCIKERDGEVFHDEITREELFNLKGDERIIRSLVNKLLEYKIVVTYYGGDGHFDLPFVRAKSVHYDIDFPGYQDLYSYDLYGVIKYKFSALSRRSLDATCNYFNIEGKTPIDKEYWRKAKYGDAESIGYVLEHNIGDVEILEKLHKKVEPFRKWTKTSI